MDERLSRSYAVQRFTPLLLGVFASVAAFLGAVGLYGVISFAVGRRTREIGIRRALGAQPLEIAGLVLGQAFRSGRCGSFSSDLREPLVSRGCSTSLLFQVSPTDARDVRARCRSPWRVWRSSPAWYLPGARSGSIPSRHCGMDEDCEIGKATCRDDDRRPRRSPRAPDPPRSRPCMAAMLGLGALIAAYVNHASRPCGHRFRRSRPDIRSPAFCRPAPAIPASCN